MSDEIRRLLRQRVSERVVALVALRSITDVTTHSESPGAPVAANYRTVLEQLERAAARPDAGQQRATTRPPTRILPEEDIVTLAPKVPFVADPSAVPEVTTTYSQLVTAEGRAWFNARALAHGIDLDERIHCPF